MKQDVYYNEMDRLIVNTQCWAKFKGKIDGISN